MKLRDRHVVVNEKVELALVHVDAAVDVKSLIHPEQEFAGSDTYAMRTKAKLH